MITSHSYLRFVFGVVMFVAMIVLAISTTSAADRIIERQPSLQTAQKHAEKSIFGYGSIRDKLVLAGWARNLPVSSLYSTDTSVTQNPAEFSDSVKITAVEGTITGEFGTSVALDGDTLIVGAPFEKNALDRASGAAYIFVRGAAGWTQQAKLTVTEGNTNKYFGNSVAVSGNTAIVGARFDGPDSNNTQGSAYIFVRNGGNWTLQQKLIGAAGSQFGASVAIDKDTVAVGAASDRIENEFRGSAYIFHRIGEDWFQQAKLIDPIGRDSNQFGISIAVNGDTVIVGSRYAVGAKAAPGAACVFIRKESAWMLQQRLTAPDANDGDEFGFSVALEGNTAVVGVPASRDEKGIQRGSSYIYVRNDAGWTQQQKISAPPAAARFGGSVDISGDTIVVGAPRDDALGKSHSGSAYVYVKRDSNWEPQARLLAFDSKLSDFLGAAVTVSGNKFIIGAPGVDIGSNGNQGAAYYFIQPTLAPDLQPASDTGASSADNITTSHNLFFNIGGVAPGATVELLRNGTVINTAVAVGGTVSFNDAAITSEGVFAYSTRQTVSGVVSSPSEPTFITVDNTAPMVTINQSATEIDPTPEQSVRFTAVFSEPVVGFDISDVSFAASTAQISGPNSLIRQNPTTFLISANNIISDAQKVIASIPAGGAQDLAGNVNADSTSVDNTIMVDNVRPSVTINQAAGQLDPTANQPINFTVVFSEPVGGFNLSDISFAGSTANVLTAFITVTGGDRIYNVSITGVTSNGGVLRVSIRPEGALDAGSNPSVASTSTDNAVTIDNVPPSVTINQAAGQLDPTMFLPVNFTVVFSEAVTGFDAADVSLTGSSINTSAAAINITGSGTTYNVTVGNVTSNGGNIRATVRSGGAADTFGNLNLASTSFDNTVIVDNVAPTVSINQAVGQTDPTSTQPINFTVVFSETVSGFDASDVSLAGSTANVAAANVTVTGSGSAYNVRISGVTSSGQIRANIAAGAARDVAGNLSSASTSTDNVVTVNLKSTFFDYDGDGKADVGVYRPSNGVWYLLNSTAGFSAVQFGIPTDKIVPADYDGDGKTDIAVWRGGNWYLQRSSQGFVSVPFGTAGDVPAPADFDGDGKAEIVVYRPSNGTWYVLNLANNQFTAVQFGISEDKPVTADYDGDGRADYAVYRPSNGVWYLLQSAKGFAAVQFGISTDKPAVGDYDGDGKADQAVYRPENGTWYLLQSTKGFAAVQFGISTDVPSPADFDGDGKTDIALFRPEVGNWYQMKSNQGFGSVQFGSNSDKPVSNAFVD